jgi:hypothetical protein
MEKQNDNIRERLLARLPQPENLAAYREETASLLAKHEKALFWERMPFIVSSVSVVAILIANWFWAHKTGAAMNQFVWFGVGLLVFASALIDLRYRIYRSKVDLLVELKQVQLQILELQASLGKSGNARGL